MVYKVVEFKGTPRMKLSEETEKITTPGAKGAVRAFDSDNTPMFDVLCFSTEYEAYCNIKPNETLTFTRKKTGEVVSVANIHHFEGLTPELFNQGKVMVDLGPIKQRREHCLSQIKQFGGAKRLLDSAQPEYEVLLSNECYALYNKMFKELSR
jgi:nicotinate phosphoribosyltransferase